VPHFGKGFKGPRAYTLGRGVRGNQLGMETLQVQQAPEKGVEGGIGYLRVVEDMVAIVMVADLIL